MFCCAEVVPVNDASTSVRIEVRIMSRVKYLAALILKE